MARDWDPEVAKVFDAVEDQDLSAEELIALFNAPETVPVQEVNRYRKLPDSAFLIWTDEPGNHYDSPFDVY